MPVRAKCGTNSVHPKPFCYAQANTHDPATTLSIVVAMTPRKAPDVSAVGRAAFAFNFWANAPVGAAEAVPSTTSDGGDAPSQRARMLKPSHESCMIHILKKLAPHCCEIAS